MIKVQHLFLVCSFLLIAFYAKSQQLYEAMYYPVDKDSTFIESTLNLKKQFVSREECQLYINQLIPSLQAMGYVTASIDSLQYDSTRAHIRLFTGSLYRWESVQAASESLPWLSKIGWDETMFTNEAFNYSQISRWQQRMLNYFENNGYPFAKIYFDSLSITDNKVWGLLKINTGLLYHVDSIQVTGNAKISPDYLQRYLDIRNGSVYNKEKIQHISSQIKKLAYVEEAFPPRFHWTSTGGFIELFLKQKKSSQINFIIGFLPNNEQLNSKKMLITGEALINLKNAFGSGELIGLAWQKLQVSSQRLNLSYQQPYLFHSPFGLDFGFDMFRKDSNYLNFEFRLGTQFAIDPRQHLKIFLQQFNTIVNSINVNELIQSRKLPDQADVRVTNAGLEYNLNTTNYMYNPVSGFELNFLSTAGNKKIKPNNQVLELKDPADPSFDFRTLYDTVKAKSYQVRTILYAAKYFPFWNRNRNTIKAAINGGYLVSPNIFRNELFQVGGYRLLRGFDEQSQFLSQYGLGTLEYRYLIGENSYFNIFTDGGWGRNTGRGAYINHSYISFGAGMAFETKIGLFNLAWALGKRDDTRFNLRQSKIHFGFINYF